MLAGRLTPSVRLDLCLLLCRLRTSRKLWNVTERQETVTEDCYSYTIGTDLLVVLTNRGSNLGNATKTCTVTLPASSQLLRKGLTGVQDVLDFQQVRDMGACCCYRVCFCVCVRACACKTVAPSWLPATAVWLRCGVRLLVWCTQRSSRLWCFQPQQFVLSCPPAVQQDNASPPQGVTWDAAARTLTVKTPGGNPRVLTSTRFTPSFSTNSKHTEIMETQKPVYEQDNVRINWGRAPELFEAGKSNGAAGAARMPWLLAAVMGAAAAALAGVL